MTIPNDRFTFKLTDSLGTVSMAFPQQTDTFFSWIQQSDCGRPCEQDDYRFQSKQNRIFPESGFFWDGEPEDSVDQLSIYHQRPYRLEKFDDSLIFRLRDNLLKKTLAGINIASILSDTFAKIGDRTFYILKTADFNHEKNVRDRRLIAFTTVSGTGLEFHYKLLTSRYDSILIHFFDSSIKNLASVRIKDGG